VKRTRIASGAPLEEQGGFSRAVRVRLHVWVSGTAPFLPGDPDPPSDPYQQAVICLVIIERALAEAGASLDDVVRTRIYVTDAGCIEAVGRAHAEAFATARPATTGIVTELLDPRWLTEIEAEAVVSNHR
jgi:enamine deaminase RidA (YjgF/YER057c/UK114 family)